MKVAIIGSRACGDLTLKKVIENIPKNTTSIISGGAIGVDTLAKKAAQKLNIPFEEILPNYKTFGKCAPLIRNKTIVEKSDIIIAFWNYKSRGTQNALLHGLKNDKKIKIVEIV